jgi:23S rRNA (cytosine1962-C5)-methyltransferase
MSEYKILTTLVSEEYELLDSGDGEKLERYGEVVVARPDPQSLWNKNLSESEWEQADAYFTRDSRDANWSVRRDLPDRWPVALAGLKFWIKLSAFKHTGIFPEQVGNWNWIREKIDQAKRVEPVRVLNLFGYTGGASLAAAQAGAEVVHVDGSKSAIGWARDNATLSNLSEKPIRWILDDAQKFVAREIKRGKKYDGIIMDPPAFGHGAEGEVWKIEEDLLPLLDSCTQILSDNPLFFIINGYASGYSALAYQNSLGDLMKKFGGHVEIGELTISEKNTQRLLPAGIFARWSSV